jgi:hypothetical protein
MVFGAVRSFVYAAGVVTKRPYLRMLGLRGVAEYALKQCRYDVTEAKASELLSLAAQFHSDWYYGNALHHGYLLRGLAALARNDFIAAGTDLLAAGRTPGSPQLNSFGPNMRLARDLLVAGYAAPVIEYFRLCGVFWKRDNGKLQRWAEEVRAGTVPDFGPHLVY